ncbi:unnamed protein product [Porites evermanni]|uniref:Uncharacterized protein n=1 Tax=Porites evermanni TaxID=104178 RepID=A0ABN8Q136_9CNID|nr:unnamed protein product [Porites evermanni]
MACRILNTESVAKFNNHNAFGNQPKTMFLRGMLKDEILSIVKEKILCPDEPTTKRGRRKHVAKKTFPNNVGEFVEFDQADNLCTRLLNIESCAIAISGFLTE